MFFFLGGGGGGVIEKCDLLNLFELQAKNFDQSNMRVEGFSRSGISDDYLVKDCKRCKRMKKGKVSFLLQPGLDTTTVTQSKFR